MAFFRWIWGGKKTTPAATVVSPPDGKLDLVTRCTSCDYEGDESEFLTEDPDDTVCPRCGANTPIYEM